MDYKEAIQRIKEHMKAHDLAEFSASAQARLNEALNMAIRALEEKIKDSWDSPPMGGFHDD